MTRVNLPAIINTSSSSLQQLTAALGVPRDVLASDEEIARAWDELPRLLTRIPPALRSEFHVRMCVAVSSGLFDSAINYAWNSAIVELRNKVRTFGLHIVAQMIKGNFDEQKLVDLKDAELIDLCLKLNLISEDAYFFLDQCRDVRNNFSTAHPPMGTIDDDEFVVFLSRCVKYALSTTSNPRGVDTRALIQSVKATRQDSEQSRAWADRIAGTHDAQQELIFSMLHGVYCDPASSEEARLNALALCAEFANSFSPAVQSELINRHSDYVAEGQAKRRAASHTFFEKLGLLSLLTELDQHTLVSSACKRLLSVHQAWDNFYNEPPFAERLREISRQISIPETAQPEFVGTVVACAVGNKSGVSAAAMPHYAAMIKSFSPREIAIMLELPNTHTIVGVRIKSYARCKAQFRELVAILDRSSIPTTLSSAYEMWTA